VRGIRDALDANRDAHGAEALYHELSRLSDAELTRRGTDRSHIVRLAFDHLTVGQEPASFRRQGDTGKTRNANPRRGS
jgi:hypothetical protein